MRVRFRPWHLAFLVVVLCVAVIGGLEFLRVRASLDVAQLVGRLPDGDASVFYLDVTALREAGLVDLLSRTDVDVEADYRSFVEDTGFDYTEDLDAALVAFHVAETFVLLKGRFDWGSLVDFAERRQGDCYNGVCRMPGSQPERRISFFALTPMVMAMAVSRDEWAALALAEATDAVAETPPDAPAWMMVSGKVLKHSDWLPAGTRSFVSAMEQAGLVTIALGPDGNDFEARLRVDCNSEAQAAKLAAQMRNVTGMLQSLIRREHKTPNPLDLSGVLTAGEFQYQENRVNGRWPISRGFVQAVMAGSD